MSEFLVRVVPDGQGYVATCQPVDAERVAQTLRRDEGLAYGWDHTCDQFGLFDKETREFVSHLGSKHPASQEVTIGRARVLLDALLEVEFSVQASTALGAMLAALCQAKLGQEVPAGLAKLAGDLRGWTEGKAVSIQSLADDAEAVLRAAGGQDGQ